MGKKLRWGAFFQHFPVIHEHDAIAHFALGW